MLEAIATKILESASTSAISILADAVRRENEELLRKKRASVDEINNQIKKGKSQKPQPIEEINKLTARRNGLLERKVNPIEASFVAPADEVKSAIFAHLDEVRNWSTMINISDSKTSKLVNKIFVELDTYLMPLNTQLEQSERANIQQLFPALINSESHCVILGQPGAGKTTSLQKICSDYFRIGKVLLNYSFPLLVRLRDLSNSDSNHPIINKIQEILGINVEFASENQAPMQGEFFELTIADTIVKYIDGLRIVLLLDGFDEIASEKAKESALKDIELLSRKLRKSKLLVTSRTREFRYKLSSIRQFELAPLSPAQIEDFANKWLGTQHSAKDFLRRVASSPFADNAIRPLTLAHLCAIYERIKRLPDKPKSVYRKIIYLLLEEWDSQRDVIRKSRYAEFDSDRKLEFLAQVSYMLTIRGLTIFGAKELKTVYSEIHAEYGLPANQATKVIGEIESHSGLIIEGGYNSFEFAHKSLQEFLTADYLVRLPTATVLGDLAYKLPNELAIATALSSKPAAYMCDIALRVSSFSRMDADWYSIYLSRVALEKPDLHPTDPLENTIGALTLLTYSRQPSTYLELLRPIIPKNALRLLEKYYKGGSILQDDISTLTRKESHPKINLPEVLWLPVSLQ